MSKYRYRSGDTIVLKARVLGSTQPEGPGRIVSELPEAHGLGRYRVRFQNENFERSISQDDIDTAVSPERADDVQSASSPHGESSWVNTKAIRIRK